MQTTLKQKLQAIGLRYVAEHLDDILDSATRKRLSPVQLLEYVVAVEDQDRAARSTQRRLKRSHVGTFKPMADFDWSWPDQINRDAVESALRLDFMNPAGNIVLVANQGLGKTMIAKNIAYQAILAGHTVAFVSASQLLLDLAAQETSRALDRRLRYWAQIKLLCIDELGYLSYDNRNADLLFQVISRRYEKKPLVLTTILVFKDWPSIFPNAACTTALIDRVIHHASLIPIHGESYRRRDAQLSTRRPRSKSNKPSA